MPLEPLRLPAVLRAPPGDLLQEAHREEGAQAMGAGIVRRSEVILMSLAEASAAVAADLIEPSLVARIVDRGGDAGSALGSEEDVVVRRALLRKLHAVSRTPGARRSLTR